MQRKKLLSNAKALLTVSSRPQTSPAQYAENKAIDPLRVQENTGKGHKHWIQRIFDWLGISETTKQNLRKFFTWFKQPSNILAVAAIVVVAVVPMIEKVLKSDEELRDKISALLDAIHKVAQVDQREVQSQLGPDQYGIASAERQVELERATAIAHSIKHDAYPGVLIALSDQLCESGRSDEAQVYLWEVITRGVGIRLFSERPSPGDLAQAHVTSANCHQAIATSTAAEKQIVDYEMSTAIKLLETDPTDHGRGQLAIIYKVWADLDERMGESQQAAQRRAKMRETIGKLTVVDPSLMALLHSGPHASDQSESLPLPPPLLTPDNVPRSFEGRTYIVSYKPGSNSEVAILPREDRQGNFEGGGALYLYPNGALTEIYQVYGSSNIPGKGVVRIYFSRVVPTSSTIGGGPEKVDLTWTIQTMTDESISGVESQNGHSPRAFVARFSASTSPNPTSALQ